MKHIFLLRDHMVHIVTGSLFVGLLECSRPKVPPPSQKKRNREADFAPAGCKFCRCLNSILRCLVDLGWRSKGDTSFAGSLQVATHCIIDTFPHLCFISTCQVILSTAMFWVILQVVSMFCTFVWRLLPSMSRTHSDRWMVFIVTFPSP